MKRTRAVMLLSMLALPWWVQAAVDETIRYKDSIEIQAPIEAVWRRAGNFGDLGWHPAVGKTEITAGTNNQVGAARRITLKDGGTIDELLTEYDEAAFSLRYKITEGVLPVRDYAATLSLKAVDGKTVVTWRSTFKRKDPGKAPAAGQDDDSAKAAIAGVFKAGLENLKALSER